MTGYDPEARWYASKDDGNTPSVYDQVDGTQEALPGETLWAARRIAAHRNGHHTRPNPRCSECKEGTS